MEEAFKQNDILKRDGLFLFVWVSPLSQNPPCILIFFSLTRAGQDVSFLHSLKYREIWNDGCPAERDARKPPSVCPQCLSHAAPGPRSEFWVACYSYFLLPFSFLLPNCRVPRERLFHVLQLPTQCLKLCLIHSRLSINMGWVEFKQKQRTENQSWFPVRVYSDLILVIYKMKGLN